MEKHKKIVCLGGGNAMPKAVLAGLKKYPVELSVISAHGDDGGSAGKLRERDKTSVSFGDMRRAAYQLSAAPIEIREELNSRDKEGFVVSNLNASAIVGKTHNPEDGINYLIKVFAIPTKYKLLFATFDDTTLCAQLEDGTIIKKETNIDIPKHDASLKIKRVFLEPAATANFKAIEEIKRADAIVIGPGDIFSSLAQILLVGEVGEAVRQSKARKIYISNAMTKIGETDNFSVLDLTNEVEKYLGGAVDYVIYNSNLPTEAGVEAARKQNLLLRDLVTINDNLPEGKFIGRNLLPADGLAVHDPQKLAKVILNLCKL